MKKKYLFTSFVFVLSLFLLTNTLMAATTLDSFGNIQSTGTNISQDKIPNPLGPKVNSLPAFFDAIVGVCIQLGTIIAVLAIMYGGFMYVTAQGDEEKLGKAYKTLTWALVGTAILLGARVIMAAVTDTVKQLGSGL